MSTSHNQIVKSSFLIGRSSAINLGFRIVRTKAIALILGPPGVALFGLYGSIVDVTRMVGGMGLNNSGVRQIAEAVGSGNTQRISNTAETLRRVAFFTGSLGSFLLFIFCKPVAYFTFGDTSHASSVALLALVVLFGDISAAQGALVQGMRRISDLARISIWGALTGTLISIPLIYFFGNSGIVPSMLAVAATGIFTSWWYARKIKIARAPLTRQQFFTESSELLKLGVVFMASGLLLMGSQYLISILVLHQFGLESAGIYQAAWALGGIYTGFIVSAMGADFYPRLTAVASDHTASNRLVNEQVEVGVLLAIPGVMATVVLAPFVIEIFYSGKFQPAVEILRWICLGMTIRVISWPLGFVLIARNERKIFFWFEVGVYTSSVLFVWISLLLFGLRGTGIGFVAMNILHLSLSYFVVGRLTGFRWSEDNRRLIGLFGPLLIVIFVSSLVLHLAIVTGIGLVATVFSSLYCFKALAKVISADRFPLSIRKALRFCHLLPNEPKS